MIPPVAAGKQAKKERPKHLFHVDPGLSISLAMPIYFCYAQFNGFRGICFRKPNGKAVCSGERVRSSACVFPRGAETMKKAVFVLLAAMPVMAQQCVVGSVSFGVPAIGVTVATRSVGVSVFASPAPMMVAVPAPVAYMPPPEPVIVTPQPVYVSQPVIVQQPVYVPQVVYVPSPVVYTPVFYSGCGHSSMRYAPIHYGRRTSYSHPRPMQSRPGVAGPGGQGRPHGPQGGPGGGRPTH